MLATAVAAAAKAATVIRDFAARPEALDVRRKSPSDYVSAADHAAEEAIAAIVHERHPDAVFIGEEGGAGGAIDAPGPVFVVDPLDGTTNFLHGFPWYAVSIGVLAHGEPVAGVVLNVASGELFTATAGGGARRNGEVIRVSPVTEPDRALFATGAPFRKADEIDAWFRTLRPVLEASSGIRRAGAAALDLADVACGRFEAFWELTLNPWDVAAGILLVREAGGVVTDLAGAPKRVERGAILAANPAFHPWMLERVRVAGAPERS
ncbi:MAG: inositol monophosphatase family protein [Gemmatimonadota bacterium]|nr:inositol monophosphatase [Gemmatimonadota bacterium]